jgi:hypothetical protein
VIKDHLGVGKTYETSEELKIFHNSVLKEIATKIPTTKEELLLIKGIGDR